MLPFIDVLSKVFDKALDFIPDPQKKAEVQMAITRELNRNEEAILAAVLESDKAQAAINLAETNITGSDGFRLFVAGWRPALAWVCVTSFFWSKSTFALSISSMPSSSMPPSSRATLSPQ